MGILTPELIEKAAKGMFEECRPGCKWESVSDEKKPYWRAAAIRALEAVIPSLIEAIERKPETCADARCASYAAGFNNAVEECAKVASDRSEQLRKDFAYIKRNGCALWPKDKASVFIRQELDEVAATIRSLIPSKEKDHG